MHSQSTLLTARRLIEQAVAKLKAAASALRKSIATSETELAAQAINAQLKAPWAPGETCRVVDGGLGTDAIVWQLREGATLPPQVYLRLLFKPTRN